MARARVAACNLAGVMAACARARYGPGRDPTMDDCSTIMKLMDAHLDGELDVKESARVQTHLQDCAGCRETALAENAFRDLVREQAAPPPAPDSTGQRGTRSAE